MGVCMEVLIVDWAHLESVPAGQREDLVGEAAFGPDDAYDYIQPPGWTWPYPTEARWWARYEFLDTMTSHKAHFWAGERWDELRAFVDAPLRDALDQFSAPLFWDGYTYASEASDFSPAVEPGACDWTSRLDVMLRLLPEEVAALHHFWGQVEPHLGSLREPFDRHLTEPIGWIKDFPSFSRLVTEWGDVVSQAARRDWAVIGLRS
ncbi:hypothetical protein [Streptomyces coeruleofuscus]|uniref:Uncharacterized protein n=1 Tax=Streptomyces coeruleofuscus TaxID=66879 RepID=A0ABN3JBC3_9ACTN